MVEVGFVLGNTSEVKRYQIGGHVTALRRIPRCTTWCQEPAGRWEALAQRAIDAPAPALAGIDVLQGTDGPFVVDVNAFPSNRRLPDAVPLLVDPLRFLAGSVPAGSVAPSMVREARP